MARPKKIVEDSQEAVTSTVPRTRDEITAARPKRVPLFEQRNQLTVEHRTGYVRRWVNDVRNRVEKFLLAGWTVVEDNNIQVGEVGVVDNNTSLGTGARKHVGRTRDSENTYAVLMEIPEDLYNEDQRIKQLTTVDAQEQEIKRKIRDNDFYGDVKQSTTVGNKK